MLLSVGLKRCDHPRQLLDPGLSRLEVLLVLEYRLLQPLLLLLVELLLIEHDRRELKRLVLLTRSGLELIDDLLTVLGN